MPFLTMAFQPSAGFEPVITIFKLLLASFSKHIPMTHPSRINLRDFLLSVLFVFKAHFFGGFRPYSGISAIL